MYIKHCKHIFFIRIRVSACISHVQVRMAPHSLRMFVVRKWIKQMNLHIRHFFYKHQLKQIQRTAHEYPQIKCNSTGRPGTYDNFDLLSQTKIRRYHSHRDWWSIDNSQGSQRHKVREQVITMKQSPWDRAMSRLERTSEYQVDPADTKTMVWGVDLIQKAPTWSKQTTICHLGKHVIDMLNNEPKSLHWSPHKPSPEYVEWHAIAAKVQLECRA